MVLESRHLFGLFVLLAVLFGVVFTLGYLLGHGQGEWPAQKAAIVGDDDAGIAVVEARLRIGQAGFEVIRHRLAG